MTQELEFVNPGGNLVLDESEIVAKDLAKVHTGIGDARVDVVENDAIIPFVQRQDRVNYRIDGETEWTGYVVGFSGNDRTGMWTLRLDGIGKRLEETRPDYESLGEAVVYTNTALDSAIRNYWGRTPFSATVTDQQTELVAQDEELQAADTTTEWGNITSFSESDPLVIQNGNLELAQTCFTTEGEEPTSDTGFTFIGRPEYSGNGVSDGNGAGAGISSAGESLTFEFTTAYDIPESAVSFYVRQEATGDGTPGISYQLDGSEFATLAFSSSIGRLVLGWDDMADDPFGTTSGYEGGTLSAGTHTFTIKVTQGTADDFDDLVVDVVAPADNRFTVTLDDTVTTNSDGNNVLSGPELYPDELDVTLQQTSTSFNITEATITSTWNDTSGPQAIAVSNDNGANFIESANTATDTFNFTTSGREAITRFTLGRYGSRTTATPTTGHLGQNVQDYLLEVDLNDLVVIDRLELTRDHFANLKQLHDYGDFLWVIEHDSGDLDTLTVRSFNRGAETRTSPFAFLKPANRSPEVAAENYFNSVRLEGALQPDGTRPTAEVKDDDAISNDGREITPGVLRDQSISTEAGAAFRANALLQAALENDALRGTIDTYPSYVEPGFAYEIDFGQGPEFKTLESLSITESVGDVGATAEFVTREQLSETISNLKREGRNLGNQV